MAALRFAILMSMAMLFTAISADGSDQTLTSIPTTSAMTLPASSPPPRLRNCTDVELKQANATMDGALACFKDFIVALLDNREPQYKTLDILKINLTSAFEAHSACSQTRISKEQQTFFLDFVEFSVKDDKFLNFIKDGGLDCVNEKRDVIVACYSTGTGLAMSQRFGFSDLHQLVVNKHGCGDAKTIRKCIVKDFGAANSSTTCTTKALAYITSLFKYVHDKMNCPKRPTHAPNVSARYPMSYIAIISVCAVITVVGVTASIVLWRKRKN